VNIQMIEDMHVVHYKDDGTRITELARDRSIVLCKVEHPIAGKDSSFMRTEYVTWYSREIGIYSLGHYFTQTNKAGAMNDFFERWVAEDDE
jgi:hypothetical protein